MKSQKYCYSQYFNKLTLHGHKHTATETKITSMELFFFPPFLKLLLLQKLG